MMLSCPHCGSPDVNALEIADEERDCVYECESCEEQLNGDELVGTG